MYVAAEKIVFSNKKCGAESYRSGAHGQVIGANTKGADSAGRLTNRRSTVTIPLTRKILDAILLITTSNANAGLIHFLNWTRKRSRHQNSEDLRAQTSRF